MYNFGLLLKMIPLILKLKKARHKEIAKAQDLIVESLYSVFNNAVLHGGTSIWRCYKGNRFSEDIDVYIVKDKNKIDSLFEEFEKKGFKIEKKKVSENSIYSSLNFNNTFVRFEAVFKKERGILREYETAEGNLITVFTLSSEQLIKEKVSAYLKRLKIRDLYDIFFLLKYADVKEVKDNLKKLIKEFKKPIDEPDLKIIILEGLIPSADNMLNYINSRI